MKCCQVFSSPASFPSVRLTSSINMKTMFGGLARALDAAMSSTHHPVSCLADKPAMSNAGPVAELTS